MSNQSFIDAISPTAQYVYKNNRILASLIIAQGCLESNYGNSELATEGMNLFGMKGEYNGQYVIMKTWEVIDGENKQVNAKFRKYPSWNESILDLANLYLNGVSWDKDHYKAVVGETDYKKATAALVKAGYATDPDYAIKLNSLIESLNLTKYDTTENVPDNPAPNPDIPSQEYDGKDLILNERLPKESNFPQLHVSTKDDEVVIEIIGVVADLTDDATGKKNLSFDITKTQENKSEFDLIETDAILYLDEKVYKHQKYFITETEVNQNSNGTLVKKVNAKHIYNALLAVNYVDTSITKTLSLRAALDIALKGTKFKYIFKTKESEFKSVEQENFGEKFSIELMDEIIEDYGIELDVDNYKIYIYKKMGKKVNFTLDSRYNMSGINIKTSALECSTRAKGYGALKETKGDSDKKEYVFEPILYIHPEEKNFLLDGNPRWAEPLRDERYTKASSMQSALEKYVNPYPSIQVEVDYKNIRDEKLKGIQDDFWKGDTLHVIADTSDGITFEDDVRVVTIQYNPLNDYSDPKLTLENHKKNIQKITATMVKKMKNLQKQLLELKKSI
ncbi:phage tail spike protein [Bacillus subtilis]